MQLITELDLLYIKSDKQTETGEETIIMLVGDSYCVVATFHSLFIGDVGHKFNTLLLTCYHGYQMIFA